MVVNQEEELAVVCLDDFCEHQPARCLLVLGTGIAAKVESRVVLLFFVLDQSACCLIRLVYLAYKLVDEFDPVLVDNQYLC